MLIECRLLFNYMRVVLVRMPIKICFVCKFIIVMHLVSRSSCILKSVSKCFAFVRGANIKIIVWRIKNPLKLMKVMP